MDGRATNASLPWNLSGTRKPVTVVPIGEQWPAGGGREPGGLEGCSGPVMPLAACAFRRPMGRSCPHSEGGDALGLHPGAHRKQQTRLPLPPMQIVQFERQTPTRSIPLLQHAGAARALPP